MYAWPKHQVSGNRLSITTSRARELRATRNSPRRSLPMPRNALGRGLGALIREPEPVVPPTESRISGPVATAGGAAAAPAPEAASTGPQELDIDLIDPSPYQPRTRFREEALEELAR